MTVKGSFREPSHNQNGRGDSIGMVTSVTILGVCVDSALSFSEHAKSISTRVANCVGKMTWSLHRCGWTGHDQDLRGNNHLSSNVLVEACLALCGPYSLTERAKVFARGCTNAYGTVSTAALPILAGVFPIVMC